jgi:hypothetical protein
MYLLQVVIITGVTGYIISNHLTPNNYVAGAVGFAAAYVVTWIVFRLRYWRG